MLGLTNPDGPDAAPAPDAQTKRLGIVVQAVDRLNLAFHQNNVPAVGAIEVVNGTGEDFESLVLEVTGSPAFLAPRRLTLDRVRAGTARSVAPVDVGLDPVLLLSLTEAVRGVVTVRALAGEREVARAERPVDLLSPNEWTGLAGAPELLAAFVRPNDPAIDVVLRNAAEALRRAGRSSALDGYAGAAGTGLGGKARAWELAEAVWAALSDRRIAYALPPASFERDGQKVRSPSAVLERGLATCLDLTLLFAACLEQAGLNPVLVLLRGHALVGCWLVREEFSTAVLDEPQVLRERLALDDLVLVETTLLTGDAPVRFRAAVERGARAVAEEAEQAFEAAIDVRRARARRGRPLSLGGEAPAAVSPAAGGARWAGAPRRSGPTRSTRRRP